MIKSYVKETAEASDILNVGLFVDVAQAKAYNTANYAGKSCKYYEVDADGNDGAEITEE